MKLPLPLHTLILLLYLTTYSLHSTTALITHTHTHSNNDHASDRVSEGASERVSEWECPLHSLQHYEYSIFSQNGEDGILSFIFETIGVKFATFAEFGVQDGRECNTRVLRERWNFTGE